MEKDRWKLEEARQKYLKGEIEFHKEQAKLHMNLAYKHEKAGVFIMGFYLGAMTMIGLFVFLVMI